MTNDQYREFSSRLKKIDRRHKKLSSGYVAAVNDDGLLVQVPRRRRIRVPFAGLALLAMGIIFFKGIALAYLGEPVYQARIDALSQGTQVEKAGAWVMQADPLTKWVSQQVTPFIR